MKISKLRNAFDRYWWWANRKPSGPFSTYFATRAPWVLVGATLPATLILLSNGERALAGFLLALGVLLAVLLYKADKTEGYVEAAHNVYLKKRETLGKKLGKIS